MTELGVTGGPGLLWITTQPEIQAVVHGWHAETWDHIVADLARKMAWTHPRLPSPGDPAPIDAKPFTILSSPLTAVERRLDTASPGAGRQDGRDAATAA